tara:strand:- start:58 stop:393 length:336 start_codon:yes stop_codon:yes gene_type:complete
MVEISFIKGVIEKTIPKITMKRSGDGRSGEVIFDFIQPNILLDNSISKIKGMFMIDEEGELFTRNVNILMSKENKGSIKAIYEWKSDNEFQRFLRFATRYAEHYGIGYSGN